MVLKLTSLPLEQHPQRSDEDVRGNFRGRRDEPEEIVVSDVVGIDVPVLPD